MLTLTHYYFNLISKSSYQGLQGHKPLIIFINILFLYSIFDPLEYSIKNLDYWIDLNYKLFKMYDNFNDYSVY